MKLTQKQKHKAEKKGNREAFLQDGKNKLLSTKIHKSKKKYTRKKKYKIIDKDSLL